MSSGPAIAITRIPAATDRRESGGSSSLTEALPVARTEVKAEVLEKEISRLITQLGADKQQLREGAMRRLGEMPAAEGKLRELVETPGDAEVQWRAANALKKICYGKFERYGDILPEKVMDELREQGQKFDPYPGRLLAECDDIEKFLAAMESVAAKENASRSQGRAAVVDHCRFKKFISGELAAGKFELEKDYQEWQDYKKEVTGLKERLEGLGLPVVEDPKAKARPESVVAAGYLLTYQRALGAVDLPALRKLSNGLREAEESSQKPEGQNGGKDVLSRIIDLTLSIVPPQTPR